MRRRSAALGPLELLERPWDPDRCGPATRRQLWDWLDDVAAWVNHEYGWGVERLIPPCWPQHPHIAHELPVLADQRYTAGQAFHGGALEEWHRYTLPLFLERMTARLGNRCVTRHEDVARRPPVPRLHLPPGHLGPARPIRRRHGHGFTPPRRRRPGHRRRHPPSQRPRPPPNWGPAEGPAGRAAVRAQAAMSADSSSGQDPQPDRLGAQPEHHDGEPCEPPTDLLYGSSDRSGPGGSTRRLDPEAWAAGSPTPHPGPTTRPRGALPQLRRRCPSRGSTTASPPARAAAQPAQAPRPVAAAAATSCGAAAMSAGRSGQTP